MKRLIAIILILLMIFIAMYIYRENQIKTNKNNEITVDEINKIETYIQKVYMWKEITKEALPTFDDINNAPDVWVWEVVKKNLEEYELSYEQIQDKAKEIFGEDLKKEFPKNGYEYMQYNETNNKYYAVGTGLDNQEDVFLLNQIEKSQNGYIIQIVEYLEDYEQAYNTEGEEYNIEIKNLKNETVEKVKNTDDETTIQQVVKNNIDKFTKKEIELKKDAEGNMYVTRVKNI